MSEKPMVQKNSRHFMTLMGAASSMVVASLMHMPAAQAQNAADADDLFTVEEIIITARKRSESVQDVPIAVTALSQSLVKDGNFDEITEFLELVPNVKFKPDDFLSADISIRGSSRNTNAEDPGVGINRDGVYIGGLLTSFSNFYDIGRVEILRGPQAGLYGRNAVGGALNVFMERPDHEEVNGYVDVQYGNKERLELRAAVNVPLVDDKLSVRLSGLYIDHNEGFQYIRNLDQYADAFENKSGRVRILYTPTDNLEFLTTVEYFKTDGNPTGLLFNGPNGVDRMVGPFLYTASTPDDLDNIERNIPLLQESEQVQLIQQMDWDMEYGTLTGILAYRDTTTTTSTDNDGTNFDIDRFGMDAGQDSLFAEVRLSSEDFDGFRFTVGATYLDEDLKLNQQYTSGGLFGTDLAAWYTTGLVTDNPFGIPVGTPIEAFGLTNLGDSGGWTGEIGDSFPVTSINEQTLKSFAAFVEANYQISDELEIWGNLRYTRDKKTINFGQGFGNDAFPCPIACGEIFTTFFGLDPVIADVGADTFTNVSPGGGINYQVNDDTLLYAKVVTGFKAGGFNNLAGKAENLPFDSEKTIAYEIGSKVQAWDNKLTVNAAAFYQKRTDAIVSIIDPDLPIVSLGVNAGSIINKGFEVDTRILPTEELEIMLVGGYLDSEFSDFITGGEDFSGQIVPQTFKYSFSGVVRYTRPITDDYDVFGYISYSNAWDGFTNNSNLRKLASPETLDIRLGIKGEDWKVVGYVDNLTDNQYSPFEDDSPLDDAPDGDHNGTFSAGRTYGIQLVYDF